ncbi:hypothetical protein [Spongiimicrobium sp. 3-5]|uniref:hypothetical protein n=1 Tax=Spongiimicrobium sp. 3-5 TaxID=3332596 RepID=UPI00397FBC8E
MKHLLAILSITCFILVFLSCSNKQKNKTTPQKPGMEWRTITVNNTYSISLPKYMKETKNLNKDASLQYQNIDKQQFLVVLSESKPALSALFKETNQWHNNKSVLQNYRRVQIKSLKQNMKVHDLSKPKPAIVNGLNAEIISIDGLVGEASHAIAYTLAFIEDKEDLYMIMIWTAQDQKIALKEDHDFIISSFTSLQY